MSLVWLEAALPLGIIGGMLCIMGNSHRSTSGTMYGMLLWRDATRKSSRKPHLLPHDPSGGLKVVTNIRILRKRRRRSRRI